MFKVKEILYTTICSSCKNSHVFTFKKRWIFSWQQASPMVTLASLGRTKFLKISEKYRITSVNLPSHSINKFISPAKIKDNFLAANFSNFGGWFFKLCDIAGLVYSSKVISSVTRIFFDPESGNWDSWLGFYTDLMLSRISSMSSAQAAAAQHSLPFAWCHFKCKVPFPEHLITQQQRHLCSCCQ